MNRSHFKGIPYMVYADSKGKVYEHPYYRMVGFSGAIPSPVREGDLIPMPKFSKLFYIPQCPPIGLDPSTGDYRVVAAVKMEGGASPCFGVAAFLEPGLVRSLLPAVDYRSKSYRLPTWAYTAVGSRDGKYWASGFRVEYNHRWDPRNYDDRKLVPAIKRYKKEHTAGPLTDHLIHCAARNHCFAAKNLFLKRWEAPLPVSRHCNAACLGCLSMQSHLSCPASHDRIPFRPTQKELVETGAEHLRSAPEAIVSFGQGCEGEPLTEHKLLAQAIKGIREKTDRGTINLNTNGSWPERLRLVIKSGLDSVRISLNSARPEFYRAYYRPDNYDLEDVVASITLAREMGIYTMINYLVFPGITDQKAEIEALIGLIRRTGVNFLHLKNLNIDPQLYVDSMPKVRSRAIGMDGLVAILEEAFPDLKLGYFNQPVR